MTVSAESLAPPALDALAPVMVGIDHVAAPIEIRERLAAAVADAPTVIGHLRRYAREAAILSTCNRTEIYLVGADLSHALECLAQATGADQSDLVACLSARAGSDAVVHLFGVAAGIESQLIGETQILGQVREAQNTARDAGGVGTVLSAMFRHALTVGKRARARTGISRGAASIGSAAATLLAQAVPAERRRRVVVVGAGEAAEKVLVHLRPLRIECVDVANRTVTRAERLLERHRPSLSRVSNPGAEDTRPTQGRALGLSEIPDALVEADAVICATSSPVAVLSRAMVESAMGARRGRPLLLLDLAVPRDVDPSVGDLPGVTLRDVDAVQGFAATSVRRRTEEIDRVRAMVLDQVAAFEEWAAARRATARIVHLRERAEALRQEELRRVGARLTERERAAVDLATRAVLRSLLHGPTVALRRGDPGAGDLLAVAFARTRERDGR